jgi:hypothetical protein
VSCSGQVIEDLTDPRLKSGLRADPQSSQVMDMDVDAGEPGSPGAGDAMIVIIAEPGAQKRFKVCEPLKFPEKVLTRQN